LEGSPVRFHISDGRLTGDQGLNLEHPCLWALNGQDDQEGRVNYDLFIGLNQVVAGGRVGSGVSGLKLRFTP